MICMMRMFQVLAQQSSLPESPSGGVAGPERSKRGLDDADADEIAMDIDQQHESVITFKQ